MNVGGKEIAVTGANVASHIARNGGKQAHAPIGFVEHAQQIAVKLWRN